MCTPLYMSTPVCVHRWSWLVKNNLLWGNAGLDILEETGASDGYRFFTFVSHFILHIGYFVTRLLSQVAKTLFVCFRRNSPQWAMASSLSRFLDHTQRRTTVGRTPLDEWKARLRDLYLTTHTTLTTEKRPCPRWDSNPQPQQASGSRPTP